VVTPWNAMEINHLCLLCGQKLSITRQNHYALGQTVGEGGIRTAILVLRHPLANARLADMVNACDRSPTEMFIHPGCWLMYTLWRLRGAGRAVQTCHAVSATGYPTCCVRLTGHWRYPRKKGIVIIPYWSFNPSIRPCQLSLSLSLPLE
jgi:hypothetical protein